MKAYMTASFLMTAFVIGAAVNGFSQRRSSRVTSPRIDIQDHGVFDLSVAGHKIGTETFSITSSHNKIEAKAEIQLQVNQGGKIVKVKAFPDLVMDSQLHPLTYSWRQEGTHKSRLEVDFRSVPVKCKYHTVNGKEDDRDFNLPKNVLVLDATGVINHYELAIDRYLRLGKVKKTFKAFIPQQAWPTLITIAEKGEQPVNIDGTTELLRHFVMTTEQASIDLWVDQNQHLQRLLSAQSGFQAVREKPSR